MERMLRLGFLFAVILVGLGLLNLWSGTSVLAENTPLLGDTTSIDSSRPTVGETGGGQIIPPLGTESIPEVRCTPDPVKDLPPIPTDNTPCKSVEESAEDAVRTAASMAQGVLQEIQETMPQKRAEYENTVRRYQIVCPAWGPAQLVCWSGLLAELTAKGGKDVTRAAIKGAIKGSNLDPQTKQSWVSTFDAIMEAKDSVSLLKKLENIQNLSPEELGQLLPVLDKKILDRIKGTQKYSLLSAAYESLFDTDIQARRAIDALAQEVGDALKACDVATAAFRVESTVSKGRRGIAELRQALGAYNHDVRCLNQELLRQRGGRGLSPLDTPGPLDQELARLQTKRGELATREQLLVKAMGDTYQMCSRVKQWADYATSLAPFRKQAVDAFRSALTVCNWQAAEAALKRVQSAETNACGRFIRPPVAPSLEGELSTRKAEVASVKAQIRQLIDQAKQVKTALEQQLLLEGAQALAGNNACYQSEIAEIKSKWTFSVEARAEPREGGTVTVDPGSVKAGEKASLSVQPSAGFRLDEKGMKGSTCRVVRKAGTELQFETDGITQDCTITVPFVKEHVVTVYAIFGKAQRTPDGGSGRAAALMSGRAKENEILTFNIPTYGGYEFVSADGGCKGKQDLSRMTYTTGPIAANCNVTLFYDKSVFTVTVQNKNPSLGSLSPQSLQVKKGATASFQAAPVEGARAVPVSSTCGGTVQGNTVTTGPVNADCTVVINFEKTAFTVDAKVSPNDAASLSPYARYENVPQGERVSFTISPKEGYVLAYAPQGCGGAFTGKTYTTGPITQNCTVSFVLKKMAKLNIAKLQGIERVGGGDARPVVLVATVIESPDTKVKGPYSYEWYDNGALVKRSALNDNKAQLYWKDDIQKGRHRIIARAISNASVVAEGSYTVDVKGYLKVFFFGPPKPLQAGQENVQFWIKVCASQGQTDQCKKTRYGSRWFVNGGEQAVNTDRYTLRRVENYPKYVVSVRVWDHENGQYQNPPVEVTEEYPVLAAAPKPPTPPQPPTGRGTTGSGRP